MALVNKVEQKIKTSLENTIMFQIITYCFFKDIQLSNSDLKCIVELAKKKIADTSSFFKEMEDLKIYKSAQSARNAIVKAEKKGLVIKDNKRIKLTDDVNIVTFGNVLLDYKILGIESKES
jgi:hypothetical protein